jgi:hypothetical protein
LATALLCCAAVAPLAAVADPRDVHREVRKSANARYYGHTGWDRVSHLHPNGHYCRDVRHISHYRDGYYRDSGRWYRDGRYWNEVAYINRYYRHHNHDRNDDDDLWRGIVIGAAVVGVIAAVHEANDGD